MRHATRAADSVYNPFALISSARSCREEVRIVYAVVKHVGTVPLPQLIVYVG